MSEPTKDPITNPETPPTEPKDNAPPRSKSEDLSTKITEELKKYKSLAKELDEKLKTREVEDLKKNQQWQEIAELREKEAVEARDEKEKLKSAFVQKEKMSAVREAAMQAGIRKESIADLRMIDFPEIKLETNSEGEIVVIGADKAIHRLKSTRPHWFQTAAPNVNSSSPVVTGDSNKTSFESVKAIQEAYKKNPNPANAEKLKGAILQFKNRDSAK